MEAEVADRQAVSLGFRGLGFRVRGIFLRFKDKG